MHPAQRPVMRALLGAARQGPPAPAAERPEAEDRLALRVPALARRYRALLERRSPWDTAWESLAGHFLPTRFRSGDSLDDRPLLNRSLVDATGILAMRTLAAGLQGGMTSHARPWFRLALDDPDLSRSHAGQRYLDEVEARMRVVLQRCNFYNAMHTIYAELGTFGTAFVFELADLRHGFRFVPLCAGQYVLDTDAARRVDTVFHRMHMSLRQMVQSFGPEALPENLRPAHAGPASCGHPCRTAAHGTPPPAGGAMPHALGIGLLAGRPGRTGRAPEGIRLPGLSRFRPALGRGGQRCLRTLARHGCPARLPHAATDGHHHSRPSTRPWTRP